jgi:hypothetical protein
MQQRGIKDVVEVCNNPPKGFYPQTPVSETIGIRFGLLR